MPALGFGVLEFWSFGGRPGPLSGKRKRQQGSGAGVQIDGHHGQGGRELETSNIECEAGKKEFICWLCALVGRLDLSNRKRNNFI